MPVVLTHFECSDEDGHPVDCIRECSHERYQHRFVCDIVGCGDVFFAFLRLTDGVFCDANV